MKGFLFQHRGVVWWLAVVIAACTPWLVSAALLSRHGMTWQDITPFTQTESDELFYWHQAGSFWVAGFNAGYYTVDEKPADASWTPYYAWGPFVPAFYGTLAHLFGWQPYSMVIYNLAALSVGMLAFAWLARPTLFGLGLLGAILAVYSPLLIFHTVSMLPVLELGLGLAAAGLIYWHFQRPRMETLAVVTVFIILFSLIRGTWAFVLLPLFLMTAWPSNARWWPLYGAAAMGLIVAFWALFFIVGAPYPNRLSSVVNVLNVDLFQGLSLWTRSSIQNVLNINSGYEAAIVMRWIGLGLMGLLSIVLLRQRAKSPATEHAYTAHVPAYFVCIITLLVLFALSIFAYDVADWRDFRILSPFVLMTVALVIAFRHWRWATTVLIVMAVTLPFSARGHNLFIRPKADPAIHPAYADWQQQLATVIAYDPTADSRWCNTLLYPMSMTDARATFEQIVIIGAVPFGIGLSFYSEFSQLSTVKSQWVIVDERTPLIPIRSQRVLDLPQGALYRNLDSACETNQPPEASPSG